jgi:hypothetical protein
VPSLFRGLVGERFDSLPPVLRAIHEPGGPRDHSGSCHVERGTGLASRLAGALANLPPAGDAVPIRVRISPHGVGERWERDFGGRAFGSSLRAAGGLLEERMGAAVFSFRLAAIDGRIDWSLAGARLFGVPLPRAFWPRMAARESLEAGRYCFDVRVELPLAGPLVHYRGTLDAAS